MNKKNSCLLVGIILIVIISSSGCFGLLEDEITILYWAYYDENLELSKIDEIFMEYNINFSDNGAVISFSFGKGINNESIETSHGRIWKESWTTDRYPSEMMIELDDEKYPWAKKEEDYNAKLNPRKPILRRSMEYITILIYNATGLWPADKEFSYEDG